MNIIDTISSRGINELLHFTTNSGLLGILDSKSLLSRKRLPDNKRLEFILKFNSTYRKDTSWLDYVNLSISRINLHFFGASQSWHPNAAWRILSFDPILMDDAGVFFTTTNNIYPKVERNTGTAGLTAMFKSSVFGSYNNVIYRSNDTPPSWPTCPQAEVLYPGLISTEYLRKIYVRSEEEQDSVYGKITGLSHPAVDVVINKEIFLGRNI